MAQYNEMDLAIDDLMSVRSGSHKNSPEYTAVLTAITGLQDVTSFLCGPDAVWNDVSRQMALNEYEKVCKACEGYLKGKDSPRHYGYGEARLHAVREIERIARLDMQALSDPQAATAFQGLPDLLRAGRGSVVSVEDPRAISAVGANMSQRIPLSVSEGLHGSQGFFTEESKLSLDSLADHLAENYQQPALQGLLGEIRKDPREVFDKISTARVRMHERVKSLSEKKDVPSYEALLCGGLTDAKIIFQEETERLFTELHLPADQVRPMFEDPKLRRAFIDLSNEMRKPVAAYNMNTGDAMIPKDQEIAKRNVGMSRIAELLMVPELIAHAETMSVEIGGEIRQGVFMEKAQGEDVQHLKKGDGLADITADSLDDPGLKRNLADLQVLDYICGNIDRHGANMLYQTKREGDRVVVTGLTGIDNDLSFGTIPPKDFMSHGRMVTPKNMMVMRRNTADIVTALADMSEEVLGHQLRDLNFTPDELKQVHGRLRDLRDQIVADRTYFADPEKTQPERGHILVLEDEQFAGIRFDGLKIHGPNTKAKNYFDNVGEIPALIPGLKQEREKSGAFDAPQSDISYAASTRSWKYAVDKGPVQLRDMAAEADKISALKARMTKADSIFHRNSGSYRWMKESLDNLEKKTREYAELAKKEPDGRLTPDQAKELDSLYREVNKAAQNYHQQHQGKRSSSIGTERQKLSQELFVIKPPHTAEPQAPTAQASVQQTSRTKQNDPPAAKTDQPVGEDHPTLSAAKKDPPTKKHIPRDEFFAQGAPKKETTTRRRDHSVKAQSMGREAAGKENGTKPRKKTQKTQQTP